eukprot:3333679-Rhodomonas_salina.1
MSLCSCGVDRGKPGTISPGTAKSNTREAKSNRSKRISGVVCTELVAVSGPDVGYGGCYALHGTDVAYAATQYRDGGKAEARTASAR